MAGQGSVARPWLSAPPPPPQKKCIGEIQVWWALWRCRHLGNGPWRSGHWIGLARSGHWRALARSRYWSEDRRRILWEQCRIQELWGRSRRAWLSHERWRACGGREQRCYFPHGRQAWESRGRRRAGSGSGPDTSQTPEDPFSPTQYGGVWDVYGTVGVGPEPEQLINN